MASYSAETMLKASPDQVFAYVADLLLHSEWASHDLSVEQTSSGPAGVGATYASIGHQFGTQRETQTITEYAAGQRFAFESRGKMGVCVHAFDLEPVDDGTRVSKSMVMTSPSIMPRIMTPMIGRQQRTGLVEDLPRIKGRLGA